VIRIAAAGLLAVHGLIHLIGFVTPWRITSLEGFAYRTTAFNGALEIGDGGARLVGLIWLALTFGFVAAAYGVRSDKRWALGMSAVLAVASLGVCILGLPEAAAGIVVDVGIVVAVAYVAFLDRRLATARW
jgi:hypothetical protein